MTNGPHPDFPEGKRTEADETPPRLGEPSVLPGLEPLGDPRMNEPTLPREGDHVEGAPYVSYARPVGPGHAISPPIIRGMIVTTIGVLLLSWLPFFGPFIAGLVGGWIARGWRGGLLATYLPGFLSSVLFGIAYWLAPRAIIFPITDVNPTLAGLMTTGMMIFPMAGGVIGGYLHAVREGEPRGSPRRVQTG